MLGHYDAVVWYTGDDIITREPGMVPGTASRLANDEMLEMRSYMNEGGKRPLHGQERRASSTRTPTRSTRWPTGPAASTRRSRRAASCSPATSSSTTWARTCSTTAAGADADTGEPFPVNGLSDPFAGLDWTLNGGDSADNQDCGELVHDHLAACCPRSEYPQFASDAPAEWDDGIAGAFEPIDGTQYMYSQRANESYKRLTRTIDVPAGGATLSFRTSYDLETDFDYMFVEAHTVGSDDWTTLPRRQRHTPRNDTGDQLHRRLDRGHSTRSSTTTRR